MKNKRPIAVFGFLSLVSVPATFAGVLPASEPRLAPVEFQHDHRFGFGAQVGVQGVGLHFRYDVNDWLYLRADGNYFQYDHDFDIDGTDYDGELDLSNFGLTANVLPFDSGFRITLGVFAGANEFDGRAIGAGQTVDVGGTTYVLGANDQVLGNVEYESINPYFGFGWDFAFGATDSWVFGLDLGVLYLGEPETRVSASGPLTAVPGFTNDLMLEQRRFEEDIEDYQFLPVLKLSLTYMF